MSCVKKNIENTQSITVSDVNASGDITITNNTLAATATLLVESKGDAHLWLKADNDNSAGGESEHPIIALSQDGEAFWSTIGYDNDAANNSLVIRAGSIGGASSDILFYVDANSGGSFTSPRGGLNTGVNIMTLTAADVTMSGNVLMTNLPTSDPVVAGELWNDLGTLKISSG
jgi:hypothetical protein